MPSSMENLFSDSKTDSPSEVSILLLQAAKTIAAWENDLRNLESEKDIQRAESTRIDRTIAQLNIQLHSINNETTSLDNRIKTLREKREQLRNIYNMLIKSDSWMRDQTILASIKLMMKSLGVSINDDNVDSLSNIVRNPYNITGSNDQDGSKGGI